MRLGRLDLNLLVALDALLTERSVSLAADRLCLSQSATSSALGRLREYFGDELLLVRGRHMILTARAEELVDPVRIVLEQIRTTVAVAPTFDPATSDRQVRIMASDYSTQVLLTDAFARFEMTAPHMCFEVQTLNDMPIEAIERSTVDLLISIDVSISSDHPSQILFEDDYVIVGSADNPAMAEPITREFYYALGHITSRFGKSRVLAFEDWFVRRQKRTRRVEVVAPSFLAVPGLIIGTKRIATMHRRLAEQVVRNMPLVMQEMPFDIPPIREAIQWNIANNNDRALRWIVEQLGIIASDKAKIGAVDVVSANVVPIDAARDTDRDKLEIEYRMNHQQK
jgi:LysR family transcriptional regulator, nod-box dependent transcriptional activator